MDLDERDASPPGWWVGRPLLAALLAVALAACGGGDAPSTTSRGTVPVGQPPLERLFTYGSEKKSWIADVTKAFNDTGRRTSSGKRLIVQPIPMGSGECIDEVLSGRRHPHLTSPAS